MARTSLVALGSAVALIASAFLLFWGDGEGDVGPTLGVAPPAGSVQGAGIGGESSKEPAASARSAVALHDVRVRRERAGSREICGLATADFRVRQSLTLEAGEDEGGVSWPDEVGRPTLFWSDRRPPRVLLEAVETLTLRMGAGVRVLGGVPGAAVFCQTPPPAAWAVS